MGPVSGDFAQLGRLIESLKKVGDQRFLTDLSRGMGAAAMKQAADGFAESRDPYGKPWEPLKLRSGKPLVDTGRMRNSLSIELRSGGGFRLLIGAAYASVHQQGVPVIRPVRAKMLSFTVRGRRGRFYAKQVSIPRRQMVPEAATGGWGPIWGQALRDEARSQVIAHFKLSGGGR